MYKKNIIKEILAINPSGGLLQFGEDGWNGNIARSMGYKLKQDFYNFVETFAPTRLFYNLNDILRPTHIPINI